MRILGIDPGLAFTGWGVIESAGSRLTHIVHGAIITEPGMAHGSRLKKIYDDICAVIRLYTPSAASIETLYFARNVSSALLVSEARGVSLLAIEEAALPVYEVRPDDIKKAVTGVARAEKRQVQEMVRLILNLDEVPSPDHTADALGAAICALSLHNAPSVSSAKK